MAMKTRKSVRSEGHALMRLPSDNHIIHRFHPHL